MDNVVAEKLDTSTITKC